jgi:hypothetical protein
MAGRPTLPEIVVVVFALALAGFSIALIVAAFASVNFTPGGG